MLTFVETPHDHGSIDNWLLRDKEASFMLRMSGDSMARAGIHNGDMLIVERGTDARSDQIILAQSDGSWVLNYLSEIESVESIVVRGTLRAVIRRYE